MKSLFYCSHSTDGMASLFLLLKKQSSDITCSFMQQQLVWGFGKFTGFVFEIEGF